MNDGTAALPTCGVCGGRISPRNRLGVCRKTPECDRVRNERMRRARGVKPRETRNSYEVVVANPESEQWRPVVGFPTYEVSDQGRVFSQPRNFKAGLMLRPWPDENGYLHVTLYQNGRSRKPYVHRIVAEAFIGPCPEGQEVCHGPNGKLDNRAVHLYYDTHARNAGADKWRDGSFLLGEDHQNSVLTMAIVSEGRRRYVAGEEVGVLAAEFGVNWRTLEVAIHGETWQECPVPPSVGHKRGESHRDAKLTDAIVRDCYARRAAGETVAAMAREVGVSYPALYHALNGKTWKHLNLGG